MQGFRLREVIDREIRVARLGGEESEEVVAALMADGPVPKARGERREGVVQVWDHVAASETHRHDGEVVEGGSLGEVPTWGDRASGHECVEQLTDVFARVTQVAQDGVDRVDVRARGSGLEADDQLVKASLDPTDLGDLLGVEGQRLPSASRGRPVMSACSAAASAPVTSPRIRSNPATENSTSHCMCGNASSFARSPASPRSAATDDVSPASRSGPVRWKIAWNLSSGSSDDDAIVSISRAIGYALAKCVARADRELAQREDACERPRVPTPSSAGQGLVAQTEAALSVGGPGQLRGEPSRELCTSSGVWFGEVEGV